MKKYQAIAFLLSTAMTVSTAVPALAAANDISGHWAEATITQWQNAGRIGGYEDGTFRPDQSITRAEFVRLLNSAVSTQGSAPISFSDVSPSDWYYNDVAKAVGNNIASGFEDGTFRPGETVTRMQAAVFISNALHLTSNEAGANGFTDAAQLPSWAKGAVGAVVAGGYMSGYPDGSFGGSKGMTRAEAVSTLDRVLKSSGVQEVPSDTTEPTTPAETTEDTSKTGNMVWESGGKGSSSSSSGSGSSDKDTTVAVTGVSLDQTTLSLKEGETAVLTATVTPTNATDKTVTFSSSDETIAAVSSTGTVIAMKEGSATITVTTKDGGKTATCAVTVTAVETEEPTPTPPPSTPNELPTELKGAENVQAADDGTTKFDRYSGVTLSTAIPENGGKEVTVNLGGTAPAGKFVSDDAVFAEQINGDYGFVLNGQITTDNSSYTDNTTDNPGFVDGKPNYMVWVVDIPVPENFNEDAAKVSITQTNPALTAFYFDATQRAYTPSDSPAPSDSDLTSKIPGCSDIKLVPTADGTAYVGQKAGSATGSSVADRSETRPDGTKVIRYSMLVLPGENITLDTKWTSADGSTTQTVTYTVNNTLTVSDQTAQNHGFAQSLTAEGVSADVSYAADTNTYDVTLSSANEITPGLLVAGSEATPEEQAAIAAINNDFTGSTVLQNGEKPLFLTTIDVPVPANAKGVYMEQKNDAIFAAYPTSGSGDEYDSGANGTFRLTADSDGFGYAKKKFYALQPSDTVFRMAVIANPDDAKGIKMTFAFSTSNTADTTMSATNTVADAVSEANLIGSAVTYHIDATGVQVAQQPVIAPGTSTSGTTANEAVGPDKTTITVSADSEVTGGVSHAGNVQSIVDTVYSTDNVNKKLANSIEGKSSVVQTLNIPVGGTATAAAFADQYSEVKASPRAGAIDVTISGSSALKAATGEESTTLSVTPENGFVKVPVFVAEGDTVTVTAENNTYEVVLDSHVTIKPVVVTTADRNISTVEATATKTGEGTYDILVSGEATGGELTEDNSGLSQAIAEDLNETFRGTSDSDPNWELFQQARAKGSIILTLDLPVDYPEATKLVIKQTNEVLKDYAAGSDMIDNTNGIKTNDKVTVPADDMIFGGTDGMSLLFNPNYDVTLEFTYTVDSEDKTVTYTIKSDGLNVTEPTVTKALAELPYNEITEENTVLENDESIEADTEESTDTAEAPSKTDTQESADATEGPSKTDAQESADATEGPSKTDTQESADTTEGPSKTDTQESADVTEGPSETDTQESADAAEGASETDTQESADATEGPSETDTQESADVAEA